MQGFSKEKVKGRLTSVKAWELPKHPSAIAPDGVWVRKST